MTTSSAAVQIIAIAASIFGGCFFSDRFLSAMWFAIAVINFCVFLGSLIDRQNH